MKYFISELWYALREPFQKRKGIDDIISTLHKDGVVLVKNYLSNKVCSNLLSEFKEASKLDSVWKDEEGSDTRVYGIDRLYSSYRSLYDDDRLNQVYKRYISKEWNGFLMCNRVKFVEGNLGSGGGWHRDSINRRQLKFITYLNDAKFENGCFQYVKGSHTVWKKLKWNRFLNKPLGAYRYSEKDLEKLKNSGVEVSNLEGKAGDLLIVDTSGLHRGNPIQTGERYAVTQYMWDGQIPPQVETLLVEKKP